MVVLWPWYPVGAAAGDEDTAGVVVTAAAVGVGALTSFGTGVVVAAGTACSEC